MTYREGDTIGVTTDWARVAQLRRETEQAITRVEEAAKRLEQVIGLWRLEQEMEQLRNSR